MDSPIDSGTYLKTSRSYPIEMIRVRAAAGNPRRGWLTAGFLTIPVALGRGGIIANKREGDGGTPKGTFQPRRLWWRADRYPRPRTFLSTRAIRFDDAWCEDPTSRHYNRPLRLGLNDAGDRLTRDDQHRKHGHCQNDVLPEPSHLNANLVDATICGARAAAPAPDHNTSLPRPRARARE